MKRILRIIFLVIIAVGFSCEEQGLIVRCSDCISDEPVSTELKIKLDASDFEYTTIIRIYEGNLEDSILLGSFSTHVETSSYEVTLNKKYTLTATYYYNNDRKYIAVDSATPRVKYEKDLCDNPCYFVYDRVCNLKLKYTK
jgi:hypothetical protein